MIIVLEAAASQAALKQAMSSGELKRVRLVKYAPAKADEFEQEVQRYGGDEEVGSIEVRVNARRLASLRGNAIARYLDDPDDQAWNSLITFEGRQFDDIKVELPHPTTGRPKVWTIRGPAGGHPVQEDLDLADDDDLGASALAIEQALKTVL